MTQTSAQNIAIEQCLAEETEAMGALAALLRTEQAALANGDIATLNQTTIGKGELLRKIAELEKIRSVQLSALGFNSRPDGMKDYFTQHPDTDSSAKLWQDLLKISEQAKEDNRTNGLLINRRLSQNQIALGVLGHGGGASTLYGPSGQASVSSASAKGNRPVV